MPLRSYWIGFFRLLLVSGLGFGLFCQQSFAAAPAASASSPASKDFQAMPVVASLGNMQPALGRTAIASDEETTAVYDITAHVVVMPDGTRLEAHSGLGFRADDARFVKERLRGPTPPALYELVPLPGLFHGVAALRLRPISGQLFGRTQLLAHTYMLHGRPESFGCVVFRDYASFLMAFRRGAVTRLRVVPAQADADLRIA